MSKTNILILGASGAIGHKLFDHLSRNPKFKVWGTTRKPDADHSAMPAHLIPKTIFNVDIYNFDSVVDAIATAKPATIINCAGVVKQIIDQYGPEPAITLNALFPHRLAKLAKLADARLIQLTTDCVFSGNKGMYTEEDPADAYDLYGKSKNLGEVDYPNCLTIRTSFIGHELDTKNGLIEWFLSQKESVKGFTKAIYSGLPSIEMARVCEKYIINNDQLTGLYHLSAEPISKYDLLKLVAAQYHKKIDIVPDDKMKCDRSLNSTKFRAKVGYTPKPWPELIKQMHTDYQANKYYRKY